MKKMAIAIVALASLAGCSSWSTASVHRSHAQAAMVTQETDPENVKITVGDIADRPYVLLGEISATVRKTTIFNADPTRTTVNEKLRERAAQLGADAVILVQYNRSGFSPLSWGSLSGKGRAVRFQ
jgi:hypothetical protein